MTRMMTAVLSISLMSLNKHEGGGPTVGTGSTGSTGSGSAAAPQQKASNPEDTSVLTLLQEAKSLDQQGKEQECMQKVNEAEKAANVVVR
jgi:hypothetical protein